MTTQEVYESLNILSLTTQWLFLEMSNFGPKSKHFNLILLFCPINITTCYWTVGFDLEETLLCIFSPSKDLHCQQVLYFLVIISLAILLTFQKRHKVEQKKLGLMQHTKDKGKS